MRYLQFALFLFFSLGIQPFQSTNQLTDSRQKGEAKKILFIVSNQQTYGATNLKTSNHFGEIVYAYDVLEKAGYEIDFVSPNGGEVFYGYINSSNSIQKHYLQDKTILKKLANTLAPQHVHISAYKAVYYVGGGAAMFGVPENKAIQNIVMEIYEKNRGVISAVCHGAAGIVNLKTANGTYVYAGKNVNGYPDKFERMNARYYQEFPFSIEQKLKENGGVFSYSDEGGKGYYQVDGRLITGQDPSSAKYVAQKIIEILHKKS